MNIIHRIIQLDYHIWVIFLLLLGCATRQTTPTDEQPTSESVYVTDQEAAAIGQKIWMNESAGRRDGLTVWNKGEEFPSLGIGHFIWYPKGYQGPFEETFPTLLIFLQQQRIALPIWLQNNPSSPWNSREEFLREFSSPKLVALRNLLASTIPQQTQFLIKRLDAALPKLLNNLSSQQQRNKVREQFYRVINTPGGVYALVDYLNFKGEGVSSTERYKGEGWGLLQILEYMPGNTNNPLDEFADGADFVLTRRVQNSPLEREEIRWLEGWRKRINTYR